MNCRSKLWLLLLSGSMLPSALNAQTVLPTITVKERLSESITPSTASIRKSLDATPGGSNLIEPGETSGSKHTLRDLLDYQPGITLLDFFGGSDQPVLTIRGSGLQSHPLSRGVMLLENGLPFNEADGSFIIGMLEARDAGVVAARRGANAINPASDALGGEIDFYNLTARDETGKFSAQYGSFHTSVVRAALGREYDGVDFHVSASGSKSNGFRKHSDQERYALRANLGFTADNFENRTWFSYTDQKFQIPGPLTRNMVYDDPSANINNTMPMVSTTDPHRETTQWRLANRSLLQTESFRHDFGLYAQKTDDLFVSPTTVKNNDITTYGVQYKIDTDQRGSLNYGAAFSWVRSSMDLHYSPNKKNPNPPIQTLRDTYYDAVSQHLSAQFHANWQFVDHWRVVGLVRWVDTRRDIDPKDGSASHDKNWSWFAPKLGLIWTPAPNQTFFANVSTTREAPTVGDIIQFKAPPPPPAQMRIATELEPQKAISFEIGARGRLDDAFGWDLTLYRSEIKKELLDYSPDGVSTYSFNYDGKTRHQGIELGLDGGWALPSRYGRLKGRLSYNFNDFKFRNGVFSGNRIAGVPRNMVSVQLSYENGPWQFDINSRTAIGKTHTDHSNLMRYSGYTILGARLRYEIGDMAFFIQGDNLADKKYVGSTNTPAIGSPNGASYYPGNGRSVTAGVDISF